MRRPGSIQRSTRLKLGYVVAAATDTWLSGRAGPWAHRARYLTKPTLMPLLASSLALDPRAADSPLRTTTLLAQVGGFGGDVALLSSGRKPFLVGAGSFGVGHVAYVAGFLRHRDRSTARADRAVQVVAGSWALTAPLMAGLAAREHRELGGPVLGYATLLAAMAAAAGHLDPDLPPAARRLTAAGAALFMISDTILGLRKFALTDPPPALERAVMATYTAGQFLLSEGAAHA